VNSQTFVLQLRCAEYSGIHCYLGILGHMRLRILHNGHVRQQNPHWHLWIQRDGSLAGEIIGRQSGFKCIQEFKRQLSELDTEMLFTQAASMRPHFKQRELLPDDVMVKFTAETEEFWYAVPLEQQTGALVEPFFRVLNQILDP